MGRARTSGSRDLAGTNLYRNVVGEKVYFKWRNPVTHREFSLGRISRQEAKAAARILNERAARADATIDTIVAKVISDGTTMAELIDRYDAEVLSQPRETGQHYASGTIRARRAKYPHIKKALGNRPVHAVTDLDIKGVCDQFPKPQAKNYRALFACLFKFAYTERLRDDNPMERVPQYKHAVTRQRLTAAGFDAIFGHPECEAWMRNAMALARITCQAEQELVRMRRDQVRDGTLPVIRQKTGARIAMDIGQRLEEVLARCDDGVLSPFLIHRSSAKNLRRTRREGMEHWSQMRPADLGDRFRVLRDKCDHFADMPKRARPSFHEIRALGAVEYEAAGYPIDAIRRLLGHSTEAQTRQYLDRHREHWLSAATM